MNGLYSSADLAGLRGVCGTTKMMAAMVSLSQTVVRNPMVDYAILKRRGGVRDAVLVARNRAHQVATA